MIPELNWASVHGHLVLMVPGPTEIPFRMLQALAQPPQVQYDIAFGEGVLEPLTLTSRHVYQTEHEGILLRGSGRMGSDGSAEAQEQFKGR
jgi:aspartate aminotransferase-like enzyme